MNYRHAYHAGNFADVVKHVVLSRLLDYLKQKDKAFRVIDTHAGIGRYDLSSTEAQKTGEWQGGIGRLIDASFDESAAALLAPYLEAVRSLNPDGGVKKYPGSPLIARHLMRKQDRLSAIELHPRGCRQAEDAVRRRFPDKGDRTRRLAGARRASAAEGKARPGAYRSAFRGRGRIRPPRRRAAKSAQALAGRHLCAVVSDQGPQGDHRLPQGAKQSGIPKLLDIEFEIRPASREPSLDGSGMVVVNPPFTLERELRIVLPALHRLLAVEKPAHWSLEWLAGE